MVDRLERVGKCDILLQNLRCVSNLFRVGKRSGKAVHDVRVWFVDNLRVGVFAPRQPNERDESSDSQASAPRDVMRQAASDLERGLEDTDCRNEAGEIVRERQRDGTK